MHRAIRLLPALALLVLLPASAHGSGPSAIIASRTAHGIRLSLTVPRRSYPRNALARVLVRLQNVSSHTIWEAPLVTGYCESHHAIVNNLDSSGQPVEPLPPFPGPYPPCLPPAPSPLAPGAVIKESTYVVLTKGFLRAETNVNTLSGAPQYAGSRLATPIVRVSLTPSRAPTAQVTVSGTNATAVVTRPPGARGSIRYQAWSSCGSPTLSWQRGQGNQITGCAASPSDWHLVAGWVNYPVAVVNGG